NDVLFLQGPRDGIDETRRLSGSPPRSYPDPPTDTSQLTHLDRAVDLVVELKDTAEVAVGLAYSAILLQDRSLAAEVSAIEDRSDELFHQLEEWVLRAARELDEPGELRGLLHLASASERIADAAQSMCRVIDDEVPPHPIIASALAEADEIVAESVVHDGSRVAGHSIGELRLHLETGMEILAIQRRERWFYRPRATRVLEPGDRLLAIGPDEGAALLREWSGDERPVTSFGWVEPHD
ncbi:MAG: TrkA C-terminal domain-containing protein, partial [Nitriliruptoraceae bacterium]